MKKRLPRKLKKALLTKERLLNKAFGIKLRRSTMIKYMYQIYLKKLFRVNPCYSQPITLNELQIMTKLETMLTRLTEIEYVQQTN